MARIERGAPAEVETTVRMFRARVHRLEREHAGAHDWRRIQHDLIAAVVRAQRGYLNANSIVLAELRADVQPAAQHRRRSLMMFEVLGELYDLLREVERHLGH